MRVQATESEERHPPHRSCTLVLRKGKDVNASNSSPKSQIKKDKMLGSPLKEHNFTLLQTEEHVYHSCCAPKDIERTPVSVLTVVIIFGEAVQPQSNLDTGATVATVDRPYKTAIG